MCQLLPYIFQVKASTWYFSLVQGLITNWEQFEKALMENFGEDKSLGTLMLEISRIKISMASMLMLKIKDFNQIFLTFLNNISIAL